MADEVVTDTTVPDAGAAPVIDNSTNEIENVLGGDQPPTETKPEEKPAGASAEGETKPDEKPAEVKPEDAVPGEGETYEFTLPEDIEIDATLAEAAQPVFKELGLTRAQANRLATLVAEHQTKMTGEIVDQFVATQKQYVADAKADPEIGKGNWDTSTKQANQALQKFGTPGLVAALREHGMANHPEMIRFCARIGLKTADDTLDTGTSVDTKVVPAEERWYGTTTPTTKKN
jgi:hypothetical protein